jgi:hypothetical protein
MPTVKNFRRDLAGKIYELTQYKMLTPLVDKLYDTQKLNERFVKMNDAIRMCFEAIAEIATQDPSFLPSFLKGVINPVFTQTIAHPDNTMHLYQRGFNSNGTPIEFTEPRVVYDFPSVGDVTTEDYEYFLFRNGRLMRHEDYIVENTAFGVKGFVKPEALIDGDEVTLAVHRVFNRDYQHWKKQFSDPQAGLDVIIDRQGSFPNFYHTRYLRAALRRYGETHYAFLGSSDYQIVADPVDGNLHLKVADRVQFEKFDTFILLDTTSLWLKEINSTAQADGSLDPVQLTTTIPPSNEVVPVGGRNPKDYSIWLNDLFLTPGKHFYIAPNASDLTDPSAYIHWLVKLPAGASYRLTILKNLPFIYERTTYLAKDKLDSKGVEPLSLVSTNLPVMTGMGECYINGRLITPDHLKAVSESVLSVVGVGDQDLFFYRENCPFDMDMDALIHEIVANESEYDRMVELLGGTDALVDRIKTQRPTLPDPLFPDPIAENGGTQLQAPAPETLVGAFFDKTLADMGDIILDANQQLAEEIVSMIDGDFDLDCNPTTRVREIQLDGNL